MHTLSFIATVYNEENTIRDFLNSLLQQTLLPQEVIITDGGSTDSTQKIITTYKLLFLQKNIKFSLLKKKGNRSVGRNYAIKHTTGDIILCSDAGNVLDKYWLNNIIEPFNNTDVDVVAGYYKAKTTTLFQKCLVPYVLTMPDRVDAESFLPATRSVAFKKSIWEKVKGFPKDYSHNEDYVFAHRLRKIDARIIFQKNAIVTWIPRSTMCEAAYMFYRFALGDSEARIFRPKVILIFLRYLFGIIFLSASIYSMNNIGIFLCLVTFFVYLIWAIQKNYHYVQDMRACIYLPLLQIVADVSVMIGTLRGIVHPK